MRPIVPAMANFNHLGFNSSFRCLLLAVGVYFFTVGVCSLTAAPGDPYDSPIPYTPASEMTYTSV
jgi:hypothetical protein